MLYIQAQMPHIHDRIDLHWDTTRQEKIRLIFVLQRIKIKLSILSTVIAVFRHALHRKGVPAWLTGLAPVCLPTMSVTRLAPPVPNTRMLPAGAMYYAVLFVCCIISVRELVANSCREQGDSELASQSGRCHMRCFPESCWQAVQGAWGCTACTPSSCKRRKAREECIAQSRNACPIPGSVPSQFGQGFKQAGPVQSIPAQDAHGSRGVGTTWF